MTQTDGQTLTKLYTSLQLIRKAEEAIQREYLNDEIRTPVHLSLGAEAISAGVCNALGPDDLCMGTYRSHGIYLSRTGETDKFMAEMYGKTTGLAGGKAGSMHLMAPDAGLICTSAIVAAHIPAAIGAAYAEQYRGSDNRVAVFFGDGAIDEGAFWESLNSACVFNLPVLFVCEDNGYAVHNPAKDRHGYRSISEVAATFDIDVYESRSTDVVEIHDLAMKALENMKANNRPAFMHLHYYRYMEHVGVFEDFKAGYRDRAEAEPWFEVDPVKVGRERAVAVLGEEAVTKIDAELEEQVERSIKTAQEAPLPVQECKEAL